ncbi:MAG: CBS domain-containing protein [Marinibacterium sp.]|nr:CBS domain-containing protein [Marinibacterium sp.]
MHVQQILNGKASSGVVHVASTVSVSDAASVLAKHGIGSVVVSDDDGATAVGILSERDIVRELSKSGSGCLSEPVSAYMTSKLVTCGPDARIETVLTAMTEGRFRHMPVLEDDRLVGIVTLGDVVKAQLSKVAMEKDALEGMIRGH